MPKARAPTDAAREREAGPTAQHDVEALVRRFRVLADRCAAQPRARPYKERQSILLKMEMFFDYLITIVAQKLSELAFIEY